MLKITLPDGSVREVAPGTTPADIAAAIGPGLAMMDALENRMWTDLSAIDLFLLSGHLEPDDRIELEEGVILEATSNTLGQYILVVIGRADSADYQPLRDFLASELAKPIPTPSPSASPS